MADILVGAFSTTPYAATQSGGNSQPYGVIQTTATGPTNSTIENFAPALGTQIKAGDSVTFTVSVAQPYSMVADPGRVIVFVEYPDEAGRTEVIYNSDNFTAQFSGSSSRVVATGGGNEVSTFVVRRNGGWLSRPKIYVHANNTSGGVAP